MTQNFPVITLDGLGGGVGKGTVGLRLSQRLGWHFLDSGVMYRLVALKAAEENVSLNDEHTLSKIAQTINPVFEVQVEPEFLLSVKWQGRDLTSVIRCEKYSADASKLAVYDQVRNALLGVQRTFRQAPGLIADGRDMASVIFPDAVFKFFLVASVKTRVQRRYLQLKQQGNHVSLDELKSTMLKRDDRDEERSLVALKAAGDCVIDTSDLSVEQVLSLIMKKISKIFPVE